MHALVDIGANLTHDSFDSDRDEVIKRAMATGVNRMIVTGATAVGSQQALKLARTRPGVLYATAGVHPHHAADFNLAISDGLRRLAEDDSVVAIGECGLDYFRNFSPVAAQCEAFAIQLDLAAECNKPVFLHQRDAHEDFIGILQPRVSRLAGGVAHCFTGSVDQMKVYLEMGLYIGITGWICDERRGLDLRNAVRDLPLNRILLETDAPYLVPRDLPQKMPARRNEPCVLPHILEVTARYMAVDAAELAHASTANAADLFGLVVPTN